MVNQVILIGRIGKVEHKTSNGKRYANASLATNSGTKEHKKTLWHTLVVFGKTQEVFEKFVRVGSLLFIEGKLNYNTVEKDGKKTTYTSIVVDNFSMLDSKKEAFTEDVANPLDALPSEAEKYANKEIEKNPTNNQFDFNSIPF